MDDNIEVPQYFICPISLQIMKDPVTAITGITYDRESIEHWLFKSNNTMTTMCPVTKQSLPKDSDLTPNHTLRRLIQAWCTQNASHGTDPIPTPEPPLNKFDVLKLINDLWQQPQLLQLKTVRQLELLAAENERNRKLMVEADVPKALFKVIVACFKKGQIDGLEEALSILNMISIPSDEQEINILMENDHIMDSLTWVLSCEMENHAKVKSLTMSVLKKSIHMVSSSVVETLKPEFFKRVFGVIRTTGVTQQGINAALEVLLDTGRWGRNRVIMVQVGAIFELIELLLGFPDRRTTELILGLLSHLCSCADGRAEFINHPGSIPVVSTRILRVSPAADDRAVSILSLICKYCGTYMVVQEMLKVGAVTRLRTLLKADYVAPCLKDKARKILKSHSEEWKDSSCNIVVSADLYPSYARGVLKLEKMLERARKLLRAFLV